MNSLKSQASTTWYLLMQLLLTDKKGLSKAHKVFHISEDLHEDSFALVKDYCSFS